MPIVKRVYDIEIGDEAMQEMMEAEIATGELYEAIIDVHELNIETDELQYVRYEEEDGTAKEEWIADPQYVEFLERENKAEVLYTLTEWWCVSQPSEIE